MFYTIGQASHILQKFRVTLILKLLHYYQCNNILLKLIVYNNFNLLLEY